MRNHKKPPCPICGSPIKLIQREFLSSSSEPSSLFGGQKKETFYSCSADIAACKESVSIANAWFDHWGLGERHTRRGTTWQNALERYTHYCNFIEDNPRLRQKLILTMDSEGYIKGHSLPEEYPDNNT